MHRQAGYAEDPFCDKLAALASCPATREWLTRMTTSLALARMDTHACMHQGMSPLRVCCCIGASRPRFRRITEHSQSARLAAVLGSPRCVACHRSPDWPSAMQLLKGVSSHKSGTHQQGCLNLFTSTCSSSLNGAEVHLRTACPSMQFSGRRVTEVSCFCITVNMYPSAECFCTDGVIMEAARKISALPKQDIPSAASVRSQDSLQPRRCNLV